MIRQPEGTTSAMRLAAPLPAISAVLGADGSISCGTLRLDGAALLAPLCRRLMRAGAPDVALVVTHEGGAPAALVLSIHWCAAWADKAGSS